MNIKAWREIATPHKDVLEGTFKQSEFAADLSQVALGTAPSDYQDAAKFYSRTYITEGMKLLLISVAQRLAGKGGDPVVQLQTAFGGGKTHTLLAVYHLATRKNTTNELMGIPPILDESGIQDLPQANMAVIDGLRISASQAREDKGITIRTLWGEMAYQLLGEEGYALVAESDAKGTAPGKAVLQDLLEKASPCVILMDELVAFIRQLELGKSYVAGTFDSNISFIQALTEALKAVPRAILLASLPESDVEAGGSMGKQALNSLEKYFARLESVWKPVGPEEAFEIVRRRLFENAGDPAEIKKVCQAYSSLYTTNATLFPSETQTSEYQQRLERSYPIHPEIFDRLYNDWSTLDSFQRTRGVLQYMAIIIHCLWVSDNNDAMIMPGSLPLYDSSVRTKSLHYLPQGWEPVLESEVDGRNAITQQIDGKNTLFGSIHAARRTARTIFLGSAASSSNQSVRGIQTERILLGSMLPGQTVGIYTDVIRHLRNQMHYLYSESDRYWLDTKPNLRREMEARKQNIDDREDLLPLLKNKLKKELSGSEYISETHVFTSSLDIPDEVGLGIRLVVLSAKASYSRSDSNLAFSAAEEILNHRGDHPRHRRNRLIFLAPDFDVVSRLNDHARTYLAWKSIAKDIEDGILNHDISHLNQAKRQRDATEQTLQQLVRETWKWILSPIENFDSGKPVLKWETLAISTSAYRLPKAIESRLSEEEWLITQWSPIHLKTILSNWYFKGDVKDIPLSKVWNDFCNYLYLPRIVNQDVFRRAVETGLQSQDYFGFAAGKENDEYLGFAFGQPMIVQVDENALLIERETARKIHEENLRKLNMEKPSVALPSDDAGVHSQAANKEPSLTAGSEPGLQRTSPQNETKLKRFYGTVSLDSITAINSFGKIMEEVVQNFTTLPESKVTISVEIGAETDTSFDQTVQRIVKENCSQLGFKSFEFEE